MSAVLKIREKHKHHLCVLLRLKKSNPDSTVIGLQDAIGDAVAVMEPKDIIWVENIIGVTAI